MRITVAGSSQPREGRGRAEPGAASIALLTGLLAFAGAPSAASAVDEDEAKAALLLNLTRFVVWPEARFAGASAPFVICVLGDRRFATIAARVIGDRTSGDRPVTVSERTGLDDASSCHVLFLPSSQADRQEEALGTLSGTSVFTISDSVGFARMGGIANFKREGSRLELEINREAAEQADLKVSSRLLRIAERRGSGQ